MGNIIGKNESLGNSTLGKTIHDILVNDTNYGTHPILKKTNIKRACCMAKSGRSGSGLPVRILNDDGKTYTEKYLQVSDSLCNINYNQKNKNFKDSGSGSTLCDQFYGQLCPIINSNYPDNEKAMDDCACFNSKYMNYKTESLRRPEVFDPKCYQKGYRTVNQRRNTVSMTICQQNFEIGDIKSNDVQIFKNQFKNECGKDLDSVNVKKNKPTKPVVKPTKPVAVPTKPVAVPTKPIPTTKPVTVPTKPTTTPVAEPTKPTPVAEPEVDNKKTSDTDDLKIGSASITKNHLLIILSIVILIFIFYFVFLKD